MDLITSIITFIGLSIVAGGLVLFIILAYNNSKDNKFSRKIKTEINMNRILGLREGKTLEESKKEYLNSMNGGAIDGRNRTGEEVESDGRATNEVITSIKPTESSNRSNQQIEPVEERRDISTRDNRNSGINRSENGISGNAVEVDW